jgi:glycosidase
MKNVKWFKNSIIYHILIDRFAGFDSINNWDKPTFLGGNIRGIINKFNYLKELGINTIWISPFYKTTEYHGYHITDYFEVDSHFGDIEDIKELIQISHENGIKIIADFVPNHCSKYHPFFIDAQKNRDSEYKNWFYFNKWPTDYLCFLSINEIPKLNLNNTETRNYIIEAAKFWLSIGFDGFRLDHVIGPSIDFWAEFTFEIKKVNPNAILIGEAWMKGIKFNELKTIKIPYKYFKWLKSSSSDFILKEYLKILDGVLDFRFQELIKSFIAYERISNKKYNTHLKNHYNRFPHNFFLPNFLDNHDMNRFLFECKNNKNKLKKAVEYQFKTNQPTIIYYGTEIGLSQKSSIWNSNFHGDIQARMPMKWNNYDVTLLNFYKDLINKKKNL